MQNWRFYLIALVLFGAVDALWIGVFMKSFYSHELGSLARRSGESLAPRWGPALLVYLLIPAGLAVFVKPSAGDSAGVATLVAYAAMYGAIVYGVYDLTNLATLEKWSLRMTAVDIAWGSASCAIAFASATLIDRALR